MTSTRRAARGARAASERANETNLVCHVTPPCHVTPALPKLQVQSFAAFEAYSSFWKASGAYGSLAPASSAASACATELAATSARIATLDKLKLLTQEVAQQPSAAAVGRAARKP
jgi:hypothetical protein